MLKINNFKYLILLFNCLAGNHLNAQSNLEIVYRKPLFDFDVRKPIFDFPKSSIIGKNKFLRYSALTGYREGVKPLKNFISSDIDSLLGTQRVYMYNLSIEQMFTRGLLPSQYVLLKVRDKSRYRWKSQYGSYDKWLRKNGYCYEYMMPVGLIKETSIFEEDLARLFNLEISNEKISMKTLTLVRTSTKDKIKSLGIGSESYDQNGKFNNTKLEQLGDFLAVEGVIVFLDETGYVGRIDMNLVINSWLDLSAVRKELQRYDLDLREGTRVYDVLVIKEI